MRLKAILWLLALTALVSPTTTSLIESFPVGPGGEVIIPAWFVECMASKGCTIKLDKLFSPGTQVKMDPAVFGTELAMTPLIQTNSEPMSPGESREYAQLVAACLAQSPQEKSVSTDAGARSNRGNIFYSEGPYEEDIQFYDKSLQIDPNDVAAWNERGIALHDQGKYSEAVDCYDKALQLNPEDAIIWYNKGLALYDQGKYDDAIDCYDNALQIDPELAIAWYNKGLALVSKGLEFYFQGNYSEAINCYDKALQLNPGDANAWSNKGIALSHQGKYSEAIACYDKAEQLRLS